MAASVKRKKEEAGEGKGKGNGKGGSKRVKKGAGVEEALEGEEGEVGAVVGTVGDAGNVVGNVVALDAELSAEDIQLMSMMGIPFGFGSTQGSKVEDEACNVGAVKVNSMRSARQYMNRKSNGKHLPSEVTGQKARKERRA